MTRLLPACVGALCIGACATTDVPSASTTSTPAVPAQTATVGEREPAADSTQTGAETEIEMVDVPGVEESEIPITTPNANEKVCRREIRTGTHRPVRVCRTRAEINRLKQEGKDTFQQLHRSQTLGE